MPKPEINTVLSFILAMYEAECPDQAVHSGTLTASKSLGTVRRRQPVSPHRYFDELLSNPPSLMGSRWSLGQSLFS